MNNDFFAFPGISILKVFHYYNMYINIETAGSEYKQIAKQGPETDDMDKHRARDNWSSGRI